MRRFPYSSMDALSIVLAPRLVGAFESGGARGTGLEACAS